MKIKLALAAHNTECCFKAGIFGTHDGPPAKKLAELEKGDILVFYKAGKGFAGIWKVKDSCYRDAPEIKDKIKVYNCDYPNKIRIEPVIALEPNKYIDARIIVNELKMVKYPQYWGIAFRKNLTDIPVEDYKLIKSKLEQFIKDDLV